MNTGVVVVLVQLINRETKEVLFTGTKAGAVKALCLLADRKSPLLGKLTYDKKYVEAV